MTMHVLSHELRNAFHMLENIGCLSKVNAQVIIFDVVTCLPNFVQNRWQKDELKSKRDSDSYLKFKDLVEFIQLATDEMTDPLVSTLTHIERKKYAVKSHAALAQESRSTSSRKCHSAQNKSSYSGHYECQ